MLDNFFIFGAEYLYIFSLLITFWVFYKLPIESKKKMVILGIVTCGLAFGLSLLARELYFNPRPFVVDGLEPLVAHEADNGFPSDHTLLVGALAAITMFFYRRASLYLWLIASVVALSRVYVGVHHLLDVSGSIVITLLSTFTAYAIIRNTNIWKTTNSQTNF